MLNSGNDQSCVMLFQWEQKSFSGNDQSVLYKYSQNFYNSMAPSVFIIHKNSRTKTKHEDEWSENKEKI